MDVRKGHPEKPQGDDGRALLERMNGGVHERLAHWGLSHLAIAPDARVLDVGCGGGANLARLLELAPAGHVTGVDYAALSVEVSRERNADAIAAGRCDVLAGNANELPFADASFDVVTAFETVYYWDLPRAFSQVRRVLASGGSFLVCNEDDGLDPARVALGAQIEGLVMYTPEQLACALQAAGFAVEQVDRIPDAGHVALVARA